MILFNMMMSVCSFVEWSCCCLLDVFCIVECEFVGFCADQNRTEWVWSATCETVRRVFVALEHRCLLWFVLHRLCSTYLLFWDHVLLCRVKTKEEIHFIKNHNTEHNHMTCSEAPQQDEQTCNSLRTSVLMWLWLNMLVQNWNLQLIQSCCKVKICGFNSQSVMNEGCFTCPASVWRVVVKNLPTRHINGAVWRHRVDVTVRSQ